MTSFTSSSLACARLCLRKYELQYGQRLSAIRDDEREALQVGDAWHRAHEAAGVGQNPYVAIGEVAPSELWAVKLSCLFAAYGWYWRDNGVAVVERERQFRVSFGGAIYEGKIDGVLRSADGRRGILEHKTTSESVDAESDYWRRLRLDVQVGLYGLAEGRPDFIVYDVVRKPTINPKRLTKEERQRIDAELVRSPDFGYYGQRFDAAERERARELDWQETPTLYGARLTADIGDRPHHYFARREVPRTTQDYDALERDLGEQVELLRHAEERSLWPRNPRACHEFGACEFFSLCSINVRPRRGDAPPVGFRCRDRLHPELALPATDATDAADQPQP